MHYFIDGYNLMFKTLSPGIDLKSQREQVILTLNEKVQALKLNATIVFDAQYQLGEGSRSHFQTLEICFTDEGETADDYILRAIKRSKNPKLETVVTSDKKLAERSRRLLANTQSVKQFLDWLEKKYAHMPEEKSAPKKMKIVLKEHAKEDKTPPKPGRTIEESFDYYLYEFEKKLRENGMDKKRPQGPK